METLLLQGRKEHLEKIRLFFRQRLKGKTSVVPEAFRDIQLTDIWKAQPKERISLFKEMVLSIQKKNNV